MEERVVGTGRESGGGGAGYGERGYEQGEIYIYVYITYTYYMYISKMVIFINMVITRVKNGSPYMIMTAFDGKFDETKNEIHLGACRP